MALIGALHGYILVLEMVLRETPRARAAFGTTAEFAAASRMLAANQGLYNGFLAAGLFWLLWLGLAGEGHKVAVVFLLCVLVAGIYGAMTASRRILPAVASCQPSQPVRAGGASGAGVAGGLVGAGSVKPSAGWTGWPEFRQSKNRA